MSRTIARSLTGKDSRLLISWLPLLTAAIIGGWLAWPAAAQEGLLWTRPTPVSLEGDYAYHPALVADTSGAVHAFWVANRIKYEAEPRSVFYARYQDGAWTYPADIFLSPNGLTASSPRTVIDNAGRIHLFWGTPGQNSAFGPLYYSWAPVSQAGSLHNWQPPIRLAEGTYQSDVALDSEGRLHLVYASVSDRAGICHLASEDNGDTWGSRTCLPHVPTIREQEFEVRPRLAIDSQGNLHVVWVVDDYSSSSQLRYSGRAVYYARSSDGGTLWSNITAIDEIDGRETDTGGLQPEWPEIAVDREDRVHIVWVSSKDMMRYHQWSVDGGSTWAPPRVAISRPFYNGWMGLGVDGAGVLHFAAAADEGVWYSQWDGANWGPSVLVSSEGSPHFVALAISLGNELHLLWQDHGGGHTLAPPLGRIQHAATLTGAPPDEPQPLPTARPPAQAATPTPAPTRTPATAPEGQPEDESRPTPLPRPTFTPLDTPSPAGTPINPFILALTPVAILIGTVFLVVLFRK